METNLEIQTAEQHIEKLTRYQTQEAALYALSNEHEIIRLAKRLVDPFLCEVPVLKAQLKCRKEARVFYETLVK